MEKKCCNKCGSNKLFVEIQGNRRGLYCGVGEEYFKSDSWQFPYSNCIT